MAVSDNQPTNLNYLSQLGFRFAIKKLPNVNYFCQSVSLPSISIGAAEFNTPFGVVPRPGDKIAYSTLPIRFKVDEDFRNYIEIHDWMISKKNISSNFLKNLNFSLSNCSAVNLGSLGSALSGLIGISLNFV